MAGWLGARGYIAGHSMVSSLAWALAAAAVLAALALRRYAADVYDVVIVHMTRVWYEAVLGDLRQRGGAEGGSGTAVVDVGVGTATALVQNRQAVLDAGLRVVGIDYDSSYIEKGKRVVEAAGLTQAVTLHCCSFFDAALPARLLSENGGRQFEAAYFSGSFTLLPDPAEALQICRQLVRPGGWVYVTQTFQRRSPPGLAVLKPLLRYLTTIDFGQLTYEHELQALLDTAEGLKCVACPFLPQI